MKLQLWQQKVKLNRFYMFPTFAAFVEENDIGDDSKNQMVSAIIEHLASLEKEVSQYFPDQPETPFALVRNPFQVAVTDVPDSVQEEFIDLINDGTMKTELIEGIADIGPTGHTGYSPRLPYTLSHYLQTDMHRGCSHTNTCTHSRAYTHSYTTHTGP